MTRAAVLPPLIRFAIAAYAGGARSKPDGSSLAPLLQDLYVGMLAPQAGHRSSLRELARRHEVTVNTVRWHRQRVADAIREAADEAGIPHDVLIKKKPRF